MNWFVSGCGENQSSDNKTEMDSSTDIDQESGSETDFGSDSGASQDAGLNRDSNLVDQTAPTGANGLAMDAEGMIWLADLFGNQVLRFDPTSGEILARFKQDEAGPDDIAIDQQGRVFWTGWSNGQIGRIDPKSGEDVIIAELEEGANSIAFSDQGRLFVGMVMLNNGLYEIDPEGTEEPQLITDALGSLNAFDFGPDGFLWGPLDGAVVKMDFETGEVLDTIVEGSYFSVRYSEKDNSLYALTSGENLSAPALDKIDLDDYSVSSFSKPELTSLDNFIISPEGDYYVTGFNVPEVVVIGPDGTHKGLIIVGQ